MIMLVNWAGFILVVYKYYDLIRRFYMTSWKDRKRGHWRYRFQYMGENHYGKGYKTERESNAAEAEHKKRLKEKAKQPTAMDFSHLADRYLTYAGKKVR